MDIQKLISSMAILSHYLAPFQAERIANLVKELTWYNQLLANMEKDVKGGGK